jgi:hypothetical protein
MRSHERFKFLQRLRAITNGPLCPVLSHDSRVAAFEGPTYFVRAMRFFDLRGQR